MTRICRYCGAKNESDTCENSLCRAYNKTLSAPIQQAKPEDAPGENRGSVDQTNEVAYGTADSPSSRRSRLERIGELQNDRLVQVRNTVAPRLSNHERVVRIARHQKWVMIALLANIPANILGFLAPTQPLAIAIPMITVSLAITVYVIAAVFLLTRYAFNVGVAVTCSLFMLLPCISLFVLLAVNQRATAALQQQGVRVGFLGADPSTI